jgi:hypothetical protein
MTTRTPNNGPSPSMPAVLDRQRRRRELRGRNCPKTNPAPPLSTQAKDDDASRMPTCRVTRRLWWAQPAFVSRDAKSEARQCYLVKRCKGRGKPTPLCRTAKASQLPHVERGEGRREPMPLYSCRETRRRRQGNTPVSNDAKVEASQGQCVERRGQAKSPISNEVRVEASHCPCIRVKRCEGSGKAIPCVGPRKANSTPWPCVRRCKG